MNAFGIFRIGYQKLLIQFVTKRLLVLVDLRADPLGLFICDPYEITAFGIFKIRPQTAENKYLPPPNPCFS